MGHEVRFPSYSEHFYASQKVALLDHGGVRAAANDYGDSACFEVVAPATASCDVVVDLYLENRSKGVCWWRTVAFEWSDQESGKQTTQDVFRTLRQ